MASVEASRAWHLAVALPLTEIAHAACLPSRAALAVKARQRGTDHGAGEARRPPAGQAAGQAAWHCLASLRGAWLPWLPVPSTWGCLATCRWAGWLVWARRGAIAPISSSLSLQIQLISYLILPAGWGLLTAPVCSAGGWGLNFQSQSVMNCQAEHGGRSEGRRCGLGTSASTPRARCGGCVALEKVLSTSSPPFPAAQRAAPSYPTRGFSPGGRGGREGRGGDGVREVGWRWRGESTRPPPPPPPAV